MRERACFNPVRRPAKAPAGPGGAAYNSGFARECRGPSSFWSFWSLTVFITSAIAQTAPAAAAPGGFDIAQLALPLVMIAALYFIMIRPQMKKQKEHAAMIEALAKGDEVATAGGLLGKITKIADGNVSLEIASGVEVQVQRSAVVQVLPKGTI